MKGAIVFKNIINIVYDILLMLILSIELLAFHVHAELPYSFQIIGVEIALSVILWKFFEHYFLEDGK